MSGIIIPSFQERDHTDGQRVIGCQDADQRVIGCWDAGQRLSQERSENKTMESYKTKYNDEQWLKNEPDMEMTEDDKPF